MSIRRTEDEPSAIDGLVSTRVVMPKRCAMSATARVPTSWARRTATVLIDKAKAWRTETGPA